MDRAVLVVHPFTSEKIIYQQLKERDFKIITVITDFDKNWIKDCMPTIEANSDVVIKGGKEAQTDIALIEDACTKHQLSIQIVMNCFDYSAAYSDTLANHFLSLGLNLQLAKARENKYQVNQVLDSKSIRSIKSALIQSIDDLHTETLQQMNFPLIVKPASDSAARNDVVIVAEHQQLIKEVGRLFGQTSTFNQANYDSLLIQEFIVGEEYFVNSASVNGQHFIGGVFKYRKQEKRFLSVISLLEQEQERVEKLIAFNKVCLDALEVKYAITHNEYIFDENNVPYLVEMNNRMAGVECPVLSQHCYHSDELSLFFDAIEGKPTEEFSNENRFAYGTIESFSNFDKPGATKLNLTGMHSTVLSSHLRPGVVKKAEETTDLFVKISAYAMFYNSDKDLFIEDLNTLRNREVDGELFIE